MRKTTLLALAVVIVLIGVGMCCFTFRRSTHGGSEALVGCDSLFRSGDLVFRRGAGITSHVVAYAQKNGVYSHVGVLFRKEDGTWMVAHAVPGEPEFKGDSDRVKMEPLAHYLLPDRALKAAIMRVACTDSVAAIAASEAVRCAHCHLPFDHDYDRTDTTAYYCTELVEHAFQRAGTTVTHGKSTYVNLPIFKGWVILPDDLIQGGHLKHVASY